MRKQLQEAIKHWNYIAPIAKYPNNAKEFHQLVLQLDELLLIVDGDEHHQLMGLVDVLSHLISTYEEAHVKSPKTTALNALKFLMESHNLTQSDLSDIASQGVMSEILHGKRTLNLRQIKLLAKRFHVSPATFIDD